MLLVIEILDCLLQWNHSGRSKPSDKGGGGSGHRDPEIRGEERDQKFFSALRASVWSKNKWAGGRPPRAPRAASLDSPLNSLFGGHPRDRGKCALDGGWAGVC